MRVIAIVQARTGSTRFPCKILASLHGRPMLAHVLERAAAIHGVDQVVLAVPESDVRFVNHIWPHVYGGSELDVLSRYAGAAKKYEADVIIRATGDCPMLAPDLIGYGLQWNMWCSKQRYFPICQPYCTMADGWDSEIFSRNVLDQASQEALPSEREHVTTWMRKQYLCREIIAHAHDYTALKCSVDTEADLARVSLIMDHLEDKNDFSHTATWRAWELARRP